MTVLPANSADVVGAPDNWRELGTADRLRWLGWRGSALLLNCLLMLPIIDTALRMRGYRWTAAQLAKFVTSKTGTVKLSADGPAGITTTRERDTAYASRVALIVGIASRKVPWPATCLRQALLCRALLARRGIESELRVGVDLVAVEGFAAHAWVEQGGRVIIGGEHARERYQVMI